jgi:hypothetical protein
MTRRRIGSLSGTGTIHAGDVLLRTTRYELSVWSGDEGAETGQRAESEAIDGHIDITGIAETVVLAGPETLTLTLEDGRRLSIRLTSSGGAIVGRGWLP